MDQTPKIPPRSRNLPKTSTTSNLQNPTKNFGTPRPNTLNFANQNKIDDALRKSHHIPEVELGSTKNNNQENNEDNIDSFHNISGVRTNPKMKLSAVPDYLRSDIVTRSSLNRYDGSEFWERESSNSSAGSEDPCLDTECFDSIWNTLIDWIKRILVGKRSFFLIPIIIAIFLMSLHRENNLSNRLFERIFSKKLAFTPDSILSKQMSNSNELPVNLYFFNITNFEEVEALKEKPNVTEIGPYVYTFSSQNVNTTFVPDNHSVKFRRKLNLAFNREATDKNLDPWKDYIYHADPISILYANLKETYVANNMWLRMAVAGLFSENEMYPINRNTVGGLLHGYEESRLKTIKSAVKTLISSTGDTEEYKAELMRDYHDRIPDHLGVLQFLNNTISPITEVNDGTENIRHLLQIKSIADKTTNPCWGFSDLELDRLNSKYTEENQNKHLLHNIKLQNQDMQLIANSSDGIFYPPLTDLDDPPETIRVYDEAQQRAINVTLYKTKDGKPKIDKKEGLPVLEYRLDKSTINSDHNSVLAELCHKQDPDPNSDKHCRYSRGAVYFNRCIPKYGKYLPTILLSFPHFLHATGPLSQAVNGLNPNHESHGSYVKFEPTTGVPIELAKRMQFSVIAKNVKSVPNFSLLEDEVVLPIAYVDIFRDDPKIAKMLYNLVVRTASFVDNWLVWIMLWLSSAFLLFAFYRDKEKIAKKIEKTKRRMPPRNNNNLELKQGGTTFATIPEDGEMMDFTRNDSAFSRNRFGNKTSIKNQPRRNNPKEPLIRGTNLNRLDSDDQLARGLNENRPGRTRSSNSYNCSVDENNQTNNFNQNSTNTNNKDNSVKHRNNLRDRPKTLNFKLATNLNFGRNAVTTPGLKDSITKNHNNNNNYNNHFDSPSNISRVSSRIAGRLADTPVSEIVEKMSNIIPNFMKGSENNNRDVDNENTRPLLYCVSPSDDKDGSEDTSLEHSSEVGSFRENEKTK